MRNKFLGTGEPGFDPVRKIRVCVKGLALAVRYDFSVAYKLVLSVIVLLLAFVNRSTIDFLMVLVATGFMIGMEIMNSAVEALCDFVEVNENARIGAVKDIAAAAVGAAIFVWAVVIVWELWRILVG